MILLEKSEKYFLYLHLDLEIIYQEENVHGSVS